MSASVSSRELLEVSRTTGCVLRLDPAELGDRDLEVRQQLEQHRLELLVGLVDLVDQQHDRLLGGDRRHQRAREQELLAEDVVLDRVPARVPRPRSGCAGAACGSSTRTGPWPRRGPRSTAGGPGRARGSVASALASSVLPDARGALDEHRLAQLGGQVGDERGRLARAGSRRRAGRRRPPGRMRARRSMRAGSGTVVEYSAPCLWRSSPRTRARPDRRSGSSGRDRSGTSSIAGWSGRHRDPVEPRSIRSAADRHHRRRRAVLPKSGLLRARRVPRHARAPPAASPASPRPSPSARSTRTWSSRTRSPTRGGGREGPRPRRRLPRLRSRAHRRAQDRRGGLDRRPGLPRPRRARAHGPLRARGVRRRRALADRLRAGLRGDRAGQRLADDRHWACTSRSAYKGIVALRLRRAEGALPARPRRRPQARRLRAHRAQRRLGRLQHRVARGPPVRRLVGAQRREALHRQRRPRATCFTAFARAEVDGRGPPHRADPREGHGGLRGRRAATTRWACAGTTCGRCTSTTSACRPRTCSASPARASGSRCRSSTTGASALGTGSVGLAKRLIDLAIDHVKERRQFGQPLADFDMVEDKIGWMVSYLFGLESMAYLTTGLVDAGVEDYSLESAMCKVAGTEFVWYQANRAMQLKGGEGYMQDRALRADHARHPDLPDLRGRQRRDALVHRADGAEAAGRGARGPRRPRPGATRSARWATLGRATWSAASSARSARTGSRTPTPSSRSLADADRRPGQAASRRRARRCCASTATRSSTRA